RVLEAAIEVVAVERDVHDAEGHERPGLDLLDGPAHPLGQVDTARADADEGEALGVLVAFEDLVGDPDERSLDRPRIHHLPRPVTRHGRAHADTKKPPRWHREAFGLRAEGRSPAPDGTRCMLNLS